MYRSNLDSSVILKSEAEAKNYIWVRFTKKIHLPNEQRYQTNSTLQAYKPGEWQNMLKMNRKANLPFPQVAGWDSYELVHDCSLVKDVKELLIK